MRSPLGIALLAALAVTGARAGTPPEPLRALFPTSAAGFFEASPPLPPVLLDGLAPLTLRTVRFEPPQGRAVFRGVRWCAVVLSAPGAAPQTLITIGEGQTEVLNCGGLIEFGILPRGPAGARLGLVYRASSPNAAFAELVVLARDAATGAWAADDALAAAIRDQVEPMSLAAARAWLEARGGR